MKKILSLVLILAVLLAMVLPLAVSASDTGTSVTNGDVADTPTLTSILDGSSHNYATPQNDAGADQAIDVTFTGTLFKQGADFSANVSGGAGVSFDTFNWVSSTSLTAKLHVQHGHLTVRGDRSVTLTQSGRTSGSVTFTINGYIDITAPTVSRGVMTVGATNTKTATAGTVETNDASNCSVLAQDTKGQNAGHMTINSDGTGGSIAAKFQIGKTGTVGDSDTGFSYTNPTTLPFYVSQAVVPGDAAGTYQITITFTASAN